ncbi:hypothetical protein PG994_009972 [Apiospora phragmitis]|uniref:Uncharacterized protein n=1 Tax=Apiospora phragmitis TaxID=2905665 RepID=A0ABR1TNS3_9PEZI
MTTKSTAAAAFGRQMRQMHMLQTPRLGLHGNPLTLLPVNDVLWYPVSALKGDEAGEEAPLVHS